MDVHAIDEQTRPPAYFRADVARIVVESHVPWNSTVKICFGHITWAEDSLAIEFVQTKTNRLSYSSVGFLIGES